ncbi:uncharacterized protein [Triticum aestivum]|uniref:uncharacterized protein isoform X2 n=1 Tax=Triticum aestivum TaxID=4565 RepID=UPI000842AF17|nr:uncharacterized protein LOC123063688 isoform X2 [Triticum aestivum]
MVFFLLDCSSSEVECHVVWASMLTEFILDGDGWMDFDDVSLVDGYNMPMPCWFTSAAPCELCSSYEDTISTFACNHTNYSMTFCPQSNPNRKLDKEHGKKAIIFGVPAIAEWFRSKVHFVPSVAALGSALLAAVKA